MTKHSRMIGLALAAFGLFACNQNEKITAPKPGREGTGAARIVLPQPPKGALPDSGSGRAWFALTITGAGMEPIRKTWELTPDRESVTIGNIPVGLRKFHGALVTLSGKDTLAAYEGDDSAWIARDSVAQVHLFLRRTGGGSAHVCVEVEGWDPDPYCIKPPDPGIPDFSGCYMAGIQKLGVPPEPDSLFRARLTLAQTDSNLQAVLEWASGRSDTSFGFVRFDGTAIIGYDGGSFVFKGGLDSTGTQLRGALRVDGRGITGTLSGIRGKCTIGEPVAENLILQACYIVKRTIDTQTVGGRLVLRYDSVMVSGGFHWTGLPWTYAFGGRATGSPTTPSKVDLRTFGIPGTPDAGFEWSYTATLAPTGSSQGDVSRILSGNAKPAGIWAAVRTQCGDYEMP